MSQTESRHEPRRDVLKLQSVKPYLDDFVRKLSEAGYARLSIHEYITATAHFGEWLQRRGIAIEGIDAGTIKLFSHHRCRCSRRRRRGSISRSYIRHVQRFVNYLGERGIVRQAPERPMAQTVARLMEYREWLTLHRGLSSSTIRRYAYHLHQFVSALGNDANGYDAAGIRQLILAEARRSSALTTQSFANSLRQYLRFLALRGDCPAGLDQAVPTMPHWRLSSLPRYLNSNEIKRVLASCDSRTSVGLRDRAVLLLLVRLGLRAGDVVMLRQDDVDWEAGTLRVAGKGRRETSLPLPQDVGDALLEYMTLVRPHTAIDRMFLCANAPIRSFPSSVCVSNIVDAALRRARIENPPSRGANLLRHSAATEMLRGGATLEAISAVLRHRSSDMTAYYAKVDLALLQRVVQSWPEVTSC